jgi:alkaline phosphatase D
MNELSRRQWIEMALAAGGLAGLQIGCGSRAKGAKSPRPEPEIDESPTAGAFEVRDRELTVWAFARDVGEVAIELEPPGSNPPVIAPLALTAATGFCGSRRIIGLAPNVQYRFRLRAGDKPISDWHYAHTAPEPEADARCRFLAAADFHIDGDELAPLAFQAMRGMPASFLLSLGDWPYADRRPQARTVEEYRQRMRATRLRREVRHMMLRLPIAAIYDDHEIKNDWDEGFRQAEPERTAAGLKVWDEWWPTVGASPKARYRSWRWGKHCEIFMLDCRLYRSSNNAVDDASKSILGARQKAWLAAGLAASTATFKVVISSIPLNFGTTTEHWNAFTTERAEVISMPERVPGLVVLTGDQHWFAAHRYQGGLREFQVGPTQAFTRIVPPTMAGVVARAEVPNFGDIEISPGPVPTLMFTARNSQTAGIVYQERFTVADLTTPAARATPEPIPTDA